MGSIQKEKKGPFIRMEECWEAQWQRFLQRLQSAHTGGNLEASPWEDPKAFLASFEQVAMACRWPRGEWAARLLPALSGGVEEAFRTLEARDQEDYGKVKAAILRGEALRMESQRQHFRQFCCQEVGDPQRIHSQLQELCCQWLRPEKRTKEQILELLILEQFLASLPSDLQSWIQARRPDACSQVVVLLEDFLKTQQEGPPNKYSEVSPVDEESLEAVKREDVEVEISLPAFSEIPGMRLARAEFGRGRPVKLFTLHRINLWNSPPQDVMMAANLDSCKFMEGSSYSYLYVSSSCLSVKASGWTLKK